MIHVVVAFYLGKLVRPWSLCTRRIAILIFRLSDHNWLRNHIARRRHQCAEKPLGTDVDLIVGDCRTNRLTKVLGINRCLRKMFVPEMHG